MTEQLYFHALEKEMATHSSVLAWKIPGTGESSGLPSMGSHRVGHAERLTRAVEQRRRDETDERAAVFRGEDIVQPVDGGAREQQQDDGSRRTETVEMVDRGAALFRLAEDNGHQRPEDTEQRQQQICFIHLFFLQFRSGNIASEPFFTILI